MKTGKVCLSKHNCFDFAPIFKAQHQNAEKSRSIFAAHRQDFDRKKFKNNPPSRLNICFFSLAFFDENDNFLGNYFFGHNENDFFNNPSVILEPFYFFSGKFKAKDMNILMRKHNIMGAFLEYELQKKQSIDNKLNGGISTQFQSHILQRCSPNDKSDSTLCAFNGSSPEESIKKFKTEKIQNLYTHSEQLALSQMVLLAQPGNQSRLSLFVEHLLENQLAGKPVKSCLLLIYSTYSHCRTCALAIVNDFFGRYQKVSEQGFFRSIINQIDAHNARVSAIKKSQDVSYAIITGFKKKHFSKVKGEKEKKFYDEVFCLPLNLNEIQNSFQRAKTYQHKI